MRAEVDSARWMRRQVLTRRLTPALRLCLGEPDSTMRDHFDQLRLLTISQQPVLSRMDMVDLILHPATVSWRTRCRYKGPHGEPYRLLTTLDLQRLTRWRRPKQTRSNWQKTQRESPAVSKRRKTSTISKSPKMISVSSTSVTSNTMLRRMRVPELESGGCSRGTPRTSLFARSR